MHHEDLNRLATHLAVTTVLAEAASLKEAVPKLLRAVCDASGWQWGALWGVERAAGVLRLVDCWNERPDGFAAFEERSRRITLAPGVGLPGRVWADAKPNWVPDISAETTFPRRDVAVAVGLHGALCFPVSNQGEVLAVLEFLSGEVRPPDEALLGMMAVVGGQVGQFIARKLAEDRFRAEEARHAASVEAALDGIVSMDAAGLVTQWNPAAERTFGYTRAEAVGREMAGLIIPPSLRDAHRAGLAKHLATGEGPVLGRRFEITAVRKDGTEFPIELAIIRLPAGGPPAFTGYIRDITDRKRADEARRMSEFRWQRMVEQSPLSMQIFAPDGTVRQVNRAWERLWGVTRAELPGYNILQDQQLVELGIMPAIRRAFSGEAATAEPIPYVVDRGTFAGQARWVGAYVYPVKDDAGRVEEVVLVHNDVTEQRAAEEALRLSERRLRSLVEQSAAGIAQTDLTGRIQFANDRYCQIVGYTREEVLRLRVHDLTHPDDLDETTALVAGGAATGDEYAMEKRYVRKDGTVVWVAVSASVIKDGAGRPESIMGVVVDVSDRRRAEEAVAESEARFRQLAETITQLAWVARPDGWIFWYNRRWYEYTGTTPEQMEGWGWQRVHDPAELPRVMERWQHSIRTGQPFEMEFPLKGADGQFRWFLTRVAPLRDAAGEVTAWFGTNTDIEDRRRIAEERTQLLEAERAARVEAERASRMKDEFLATLSHELRTPLNAILGWSQLLAGGARREEDLAEGLRTIQRNARAQARIVEDLLDMSRIISGKVRLDVRRLDLAAVVREAVATVTPSAEAKGITLEAALDPHAGLMSGDAARLQQVMWNLLSNAVKFTPRGGGVKVELARVDAQVRVSVSDTGEGIEPHFLPFVFDRFRQADGTVTRRHGGLGLGLSIVKQLVELHGGSVRARSDGPGRGATFTVSLPVTVSHAEPVANAQGQHAGPPPSPEHVLRGCARIAGVKVLVVDDEPDARALVKRLLEECQGRVITAGSVAEALSLVRSEKPDVLVCDIGMPGEDGYSLIRRVRALPPDAGGQVPAAALTAYARPEDRVKAMLAGFQTHLGKPVEPAELIATVASLAGRATVGEVGG